MRTFVRFARKHFDLGPDTDHEGTFSRVLSGAEFDSGNTWALVFAILIASIGLNVNSVPVIIGAMLISPLMGPIVGAGFSLTTANFDMLRRSLRNLLVASFVAIVTSTLYFLISPLAEAQSELLARTRPTLYDVLIATFGGAAGVVALTRKGNTGNVVAGVAIATALMPPLCTVGFGIAHADVWFLLGALHLFSINAVFICVSTLVFARLMGFRPDRDPDPVHRTRARVGIALIAIAIALPSIYTGWAVLNELRFEHAAKRFVAENLTFPDRAILNVDLRYARTGSTIAATVLGQPLSVEIVQSLTNRLEMYGLGGTSLVLKQPRTGQATVEDVSRIVREGVLEDLYSRTEKALSDRDARIRALEDEVARQRSTDLALNDVTRELAALYPSLISLGIGREVQVSESEAASHKTVVVVSWRKLPTAAEEVRLREFLGRRLRTDSLRVVNVLSR